MPFGDTVVALATPPGESAIAMIRVSGPICHQLETNVFGSESVARRRAQLGSFRGESGEVIDQVIYISYPEDGSYTGEAMLEICCHGSPFIVQKIVEDLLLRGCRMAEPGEFTRTAFVNGRMDLSQAEAVADVIRARSDRALEAANRQLEGSVGKRVNSLVDKLLAIISSIEAYIDFPEEDLPREDEEGPVRELRVLQGEIEELISTSHYSTLLHEGIKAVIVGEPNVGKSSLLNALLGEERVIVNEEPGTTRDFVEDRMMLGPFFVRLIDTAGLHKPTSKVEELGIAKTLDQVGRADLFLVVADTTEDSPTLPERVYERLSAESALVVENKADLAGHSDLGGFLPELRHVRVSALTEEGIHALKDAMLDTIEENIAVMPQDGVIVSARHADALRETKLGIAEALERLESREPAELAASELRGSLDALGRITGKIDNEAMLDKLFSSFCIGK